MTIFILNTTILTTVGLTYHSRRIGLSEAKSMIGVEPTQTDRATDLAAGITPVHVISVGGQAPIVSAVGHQATAEIATTLLGRDVPVSRDAIAMAAGDLAICVKLRTRAPEGAILSRAEVDAIGYDLVLLRAEDPAVRDAHANLMDDIAALLCYADDAGAREQPCGTRRRGRWPVQVHYIMRRPEGHGGGYVRVVQEWGTDTWSWTDITISDAAHEYHIAGPAGDEVEPERMCTKCGAVDAEPCRSDCPAQTSPPVFDHEGREVLMNLRLVRAASDSQEHEEYTVYRVLDMYDGKTVGESSASGSPIEAIRDLADHCDWEHRGNNEPPGAIGHIEIPQHRAELWARGGAVNTWGARSDALAELRACAELLGVEAREGCVLDELRARLPPIAVRKTEEST